MLKFLIILVMLISITGCRSGGSGSGSGSLALFDSNDSGTSSNVITSDYGTGSPEVPSYPNPEPSTVILFGIGLGGLLAAKLRKKKRS